jgi:pilus assembly protein CpaB
MRVVTIVSLGASAVLGLAALVVAKTVLPNQAAAKTAGVSIQVEGVAVVVAAKDMKYGDKVDADSLKLIHLPPEVVPQGAFTTVAAVLAADKGGPPVVLTPIAAREPLLPAKLSGPGARPSVAAEIKDGMRAYTIKVSDVSGVGGHALPGDRVDVVLLRDMTPMGAGHAYVSEVVLQDVRLLAVDLNADLASNKPATPNTATLEVSVADSQKLSVAADLGKLSLALRRTGSAEVAATAPVRTSVFAGGGGATPTSYVRRTPVYGGILIIEGERRGGGHSSTPAPAPAAAPAADTAAAVG